MVIGWWIMPNSDFTSFETLPPEIAAKVRNLQQRQAISNMLLQKGLTPLKGRMVGKIYVPPSPLEGIGKASSTLASHHGDILSV